MYDLKTLYPDFHLLSLELQKFLKERIDANDLGWLILSPEEIKKEFERESANGNSDQQADHAPHTFLPESLPPAEPKQKLTFPRGSSQRTSDSTGIPYPVYLPQGGVLGVNIDDMVAYTDPHDFSIHYGRVTKINHNGDPYKVIIEDRIVNIHHIKGGIRSS